MRTEVEVENVSPSAPAAGRVHRWLAGIGSIVSSAAAIVCPACIPALAALLSAIGIGVAATGEFMQWATVVLLAVSIGSLGWAVKLHGRWWVLVAGFVGGAALYAGRFIWFQPVVMWGGAAILVGTSLINFRIKRGCSRCQCNNKE